MLVRNIFKKINNINKNIRSYCTKNCPEENNLFSSTLKVNIFTFILTIGINNNIMDHHYDMKNKLNSLKKDIDELNKIKDQLNNTEKKLENKK